MSGMAHQKVFLSLVSTQYSLTPSFVTDRKMEVLHQLISGCIGYKLSALAIGLMTHLNAGRKRGSVEDRH